MASSFDDLPGCHSRPAATLARWLVVCLFTFVAVDGTAAGQSGAGDAPEVLTLQRAVGEALERNPDAQDAVEGVESARLGLRLARSQFSPKLVPNMLGSFGGTDISNQTYGAALSQRFATGTQAQFNVGAVTARNQLGSYYSSDTTLLLTQPLLRGAGRAINRREIEEAESQVRRAQYQQSVVRRDVAQQVAAAYFQVIAAGKLVEVSERTSDRARGLEEAARAKLAVGKVSRLDVLRAQQLLAQTEAQRLDALSATEDAKDRLRVLLARPPDWQFHVENEIRTSGETIGLDDAVRSALAKREELLAAAEAVAQAERAVALRRNQLLPQVDLNVAFTRRVTASGLRASFGLDDFHFATFAGVSMPLDRTGSDVDMQNAILEREKRRRALEMWRARIAGEARQALRQLERARQAKEMAEAAVGLASEETEVATFRYKRGLSNNLEVVNAEVNLLSADSRRVAALADLALAELRLRAAMGDLDPARDIR